MPEGPIDHHDYPLEDFDEVNFPRPERTEFDVLAERAMSRRTFLGGSVAGLTAFALCTSSLTSVAQAASRLAFDPVAANDLDDITVPKGYSWHILGRWGDPLWSKGAEFVHATRGTAASQAMAMGDNTDGMALFAHNGRSIMA